MLRRQKLAGYAISIAQTFCFGKCRPAVESIAQCYRASCNATGLIGSP